MCGALAVVGRHPMPTSIDCPPAAGVVCVVHDLCSVRLPAAGSFSCFRRSASNADLCCPPSAGVVCVVHDLVPSASRRPGHFSLLVQREVTKRKDTPVLRPLHVPVQRVREGPTEVCRRTILGPTTDGRTSCALPYGLFPPAPRHATGAPCSFDPASCLDGEVDRGFDAVGKHHEGTTGKAKARQLPLPFFTRPGGRVALWGPSGAAGGRRNSPKGGPQDVGQSVVGARMRRRQTPQAARGPVGQEARKARKRGVFLFGYFLLDEQEKVTRPPGGGRNKSHGRHRQAPPQADKSNKSAWDGDQQMQVTRPPKSGRDQVRDDTTIPAAGGPHP